MRSIDKRRVVKVFGRITPGELAAIDEGLRLYLDLPETQRPDENLALSRREAQ